MKKLSKDVLPLEIWNELKNDLEYCWLNKENLACCFYRNNNSAFLISYNIDSKSLDYYTSDDIDDYSLISLIMDYPSKLNDERVSKLISLDHLIQIIDKHYNNEDF